MKKITTLFILCLFSLLSFSQGVRMGLAVGPQMAWMKSDAGTISNDGSIVGFNFGLITDFFFAERYSISSGIFINNTGGKLLYDEETSFKSSDGDTIIPANSSVRYRLQYLDIPLVFHLESNKIGYFVYHAQFGVTNSIRVGASADIESLSYEGIGCKEEVGIYNLGYTIGGGIDYYFSKNTALTLGIIYTNGFIDITKETNDNASLRSVTLKVGILF